MPILESQMKKRMEYDMEARFIIFCSETNGPSLVFFLTGGVGSDGVWRWAQSKACFH